MSLVSQRLFLYRYMALLLLTKARKFLLHEALDQTVAESESRGGEHVADGWVDAGVVLVEAEPR